MTAFAPSSAALEMATVIPLSLKEPVGLFPSTFNQISFPSSLDNFSAKTSGVPPSFNVMTGVFLLTGRRPRLNSFTPVRLQHGARSQRSSQHRSLLKL